jgi:protein-disulfide isomerase
MYALIDSSFETYSNNNFSVDGFYDLAVELGANKDTLKECVDSERFKDKALAQQTTGQDVFGITGTPGNALINNATGEYEVISGAYPAASFEAIIDKMLAE